MKLMLYEILRELTSGIDEPVRIGEFFPQFLKIDQPGRGFPLLTTTRAVESRVIELRREFDS